MKIEVHHQKNAKHLVDILFEKKLFADNLTRDDMQTVENLIAFEYQASADSNKRTLEFLQKIKKYQHTTKESEAE